MALSEFTLRKHIAYLSLFADRSAAIENVKGSACIFSEALGYSLVAGTVTLFFALVVTLVLLVLNSHERTSRSQRSQRASVRVRQWRRRPSRESVSVSSAAVQSNETESIRSQGPSLRPLEHSFSANGQTRGVCVHSVSLYKREALNS